MKDSPPNAKIEVAQVSLTFGLNWWWNTKCSGGKYALKKPKFQGNC